MESGIFALLGAVVGAAVGFGGTWLLERQRWDRARRIAVTAVVFDFASLAEAAERAARDGERSRDSLRAEWWEKHGAELVDYLPRHLVKALHVLYYGLDRLQHWYSRFTQGQLVPAEYKQMAAIFLHWSYQVESVVKHIDEHNRRRWRLSIPLGGKRPRPEGEGQRATQFMDGVHRQAVERLRAEGFELDETGRVVEANEG